MAAEEMGEQVVDLVILGVILSFLDVSRWKLQKIVTDSSANLENLERSIE